MLGLLHLLISNPAVFVQSFTLCQSCVLHRNVWNLLSLPSGKVAMRGFQMSFRQSQHEDDIKSHHWKVERLIRLIRIPSRGHQPYGGKEMLNQQTMSIVRVRKEVTRSFTVIFKWPHCSPSTQGPCMCMGLPDSCFWFWALYSEFQVRLESPLSACGEPPHRNALLETGRKGPEKM